METHPTRLFKVLRGCGALAVVLPELERLWGVPQRAEYHPEIDTGVHVMMVLDMAAQLNAPLPVRYACLGHDLGKGTTPADILPRHLGHEGRSVQLLQAVSARLRVPNECRELADVVAREHGNIHGSGNFGAAAVLRLLGRCDAWRKPQRFAEVLLACECDARGRLGFSAQPYPQGARLQRALNLCLAVDTAQVSATALSQGLKGPAIGQAIDHARETALAGLDH